MNNFFKKPLIEINNEHYLGLLIILAPLLNFISGINFDLHAPSLPAIAHYFNSSASAAKNTITISLFGFAIGGITFGALLDIFGRRPVIICGFIIYILASFSALACSSINQLLFFRFMQGLAVSGLSIGCRAIIIDIFSGHQFQVAFLYTSLAFSIGPIIAPFVGGYLQYHFGWEANFIAYGVTSSAIMLIFLLYISESKEYFELFSFKNLWLSYFNVIQNKYFITGVLIAGLSQIQLLVYSPLAHFWLRKLYIVQLLYMGIQL